MKNISSKFIFVLVILLLLSFTGCSFNFLHSEDNAVSIGVLLPLSGQASSQGLACKAAVEIGLKEINEYLKKSDSDIKIKLVIKDTKSNPEIAFEELKKLKDEGISITVGGLLSREVFNLIDWANNNGMLLISVGSTSPSLSIEKDNIFRFVPSDYHQANALTTLFSYEGVDVVVPIYRDDVYANDLIDILKSEIDNEELKITVTEGIKYNVEDSKFSESVEILNSEISELLNKYDAEKVGVLIVSFGEAVSIFNESQNHSNLTKVKWYGTDSCALNEDIVSNKEAANFAKKVKFTAATFGMDETYKYFKINKKLKAELGREADTNAFFAYDAMWIICDVYNELGIDIEFDKLKDEVNCIAKDSFGATGWMILDKNGDRKYSLYNLWQVDKNNKSYSWRCFGKYRRSPGLPGMIIIDK